jgi:dinuclear metal center YbgI/SA1388 family protein
MKLRGIMEWIESKAPLFIQEDYDNSGLLVGSPDSEITRAVVCLDVDAKTLEFARENGAQLVISHHPCIFRPLRAINPGTFEGSVVFSAIAGGIAIYAVHTNFDSAAGGLCDILCREIGLKSISILKPNDLNPEHGIGRVGSYSTPVPFGDFMALLKNKLGADSFREVGKRPDIVLKVAVMNGSFDRSVIKRLSDSMPDVLLTGDLKYHDALELNYRGIYTVDAGHYKTEIVFVRYFSRMLEKAFPDITVYPVENGDIFKLAGC